MPPEELSAWIEIYKLIPDDHFEICNEELSSANTQWKITNNEEGDDYDPDDPYVDITIDE